MVQIPEQQALTPEQAFERLQVWFGMQQQLGDLRTAEVLARKALAAFYFPTPEEGTNRLPLGGGFDLKLDHKVNRVVDEAALMQVTAEQVAELKLPMGELFVQKWELKTGAYRTLNAKQRKFVDALLDIKEGTPAMSIVQAADREGQAKHKAKAEAEQAAAGVRTADAPEYTYNINIGKEEDTEEEQFFRDAEGVWWLLRGEEWLEVDDGDTLLGLQEQYDAMTAKPKRTRKPRGKAGAK